MIKPNIMDRLPRNYSLLTDEYEYTMSSCYLKCKKDKDIAVFDLFFRKVPNGGGYAVMAGLDKVIPFIQNLRFTEKDLEYFRRYNFPEEFINYLRNFRFTGDIYAVPEGTPVFPNEPLITVKAPIIEAHIIESAILSMINGAMEHATAARRIVEVLPPGVVATEFGLRRADGQEAGIDSAIYAYIAGFIGTSNVLAAWYLGQRAKGTHGHSYIESYDSEYEAMKNFAQIYPDNAFLLVDTYDTLRSGVPNAIAAFKYLKEHNIPYTNIGIRIDSGDLVYLTKESRKMLDAAGFPEAKIMITNSLSAEIIEYLSSQGAKFDIIGVGDHASKPEGRMGGVYKEVALQQNGIWTPRIKLSNDTIKIVNPGYKKLYRAYNKDGFAIADIMARHDEKIQMKDLKIISPIDELKESIINDFELVELQKPIFINGKLVYNDPTYDQKRDYCNKQMATLYPEIKRTKNPHEYYVDGTEDYVTFKKELIKEKRAEIFQKRR